MHCSKQWCSFIHSCAPPLCCRYLSFSFYMFYTPSVFTLLFSHLLSPSSPPLPPPPLLTLLHRPNSIDIQLQQSHHTLQVNGSQRESPRKSRKVNKSQPKSTKVKGRGQKPWEYRRAVSSSPFLPLKFLLFASPLLSLYQQAHPIVSLIM